MIKVKYSNKYNALKSRLRRLPQLSVNMADAVAKRDAAELIDTFRDGIRKNNFALTPLKDETKTMKERLGYPKPGVPLYGLGDYDPSTYINLFRIRKLKRGWRVYASWAKHHKSGLQLRDLFEIHENGTIINAKRGDKAYMIRIPPRPAWRKAKTRWIRKRSSRESAQEIGAAISDYLNTGRKAKIQKVLLEAKKGDKYED